MQKRDSESSPRCLFRRQNCQVRRLESTTVFLVEVANVGEWQYLDVLHAVRGRHFTLGQKQRDESDHFFRFELRTSFQLQYFTTLQHVHRLVPLGCFASSQRLEIRRLTDIDELPLPINGDGVPKHKRVSSLMNLRQLLRNF